MPLTKAQACVTVYNSGCWAKVVIDLDVASSVSKIVAIDYAAQYLPTVGDMLSANHVISLLVMIIKEGS